MEKSPLKRLPPELRNHIYEYALVEDDGIIFNTVVHNWRRFAKTTPQAGHLQNSGLPRTCKEIRAESLGLYLWTNKLVLTLEALDLMANGLPIFVSALLQRIHRMPKGSTRFIRHVVIDVTLCDAWALAYTPPPDVKGLESLLAIIYPSAMVHFRLSLCWDYAHAFTMTQCECNSWIDMPLHDLHAIEATVAEQMERHKNIREATLTLEDGRKMDRSILRLAHDLATALR